MATLNGHKIAPITMTINGKEIPVADVQVEYNSEYAGGSSIKVNVTAKVHEFDKALTAMSDFAAASSTAASSILAATNLPPSNKLYTYQTHQSNSTNAPYMGGGPYIRPIPSGSLYNGTYYGGSIIKSPRAYPINGPLSCQWQNWPTATDIMVVLPTEIYEYRLATESEDQEGKYRIFAHRRSYPRMPIFASFLSGPEPTLLAVVHLDGTYIMGQSIAPNFFTQIDLSQVP